MAESTRHVNAHRHGGHSAKHPGFAAVEGKIARKEGISAEHAGAILAHATRNASAHAKHVNPRLKRVRGK